MLRILTEYSARFDSINIWSNVNCLESQKLELRFDSTDYYRPNYHFQLKSSAEIRNFFDEIRRYHNEMQDKW